MYMIEITEDKMDGLAEHLGKGLRCLNKAMEFIEDIREHSRMNERFDDDDYYDEQERDERYGNRGGRYGGGNMNMRRGQGGGRYSRY